MKISAFKHFLIVGLAFAVLPAFFVDLFIGITMGVIERRYDFDVSSSYSSGLLETAFFIAAMSLCMSTGNKFIARRLEKNLARPVIVQSTLLFALCVLALISIQFFNIYKIEMAFVYKYPLEVLEMVSLPIIKILALPTLYYFFAMRQLHRDAV